MEHKDDVKYAAEIMPGGTPLPAGWKVVAKEPFAVSGPCPSCFGNAYGPLIKDFDDGEPDRELTREIYAECSCGFSHGGDGATSCGRSWIVTLQSPDAETRVNDG
ncbi:hypothetical protein [Serinicoccus sediminis]|uniref:hypothetical protein n=1 Tax=Serinicoccus sediminis TaxID=2306021 RepID=UPI0010218676|nr:hypothetical protein [Serinicoccus sediminis]